MVSALLSVLTLFTFASAEPYARASASAADIIQPAGVGSASWPAKCPDVIDTQKSDQPKIYGFIFNGESFTRLADGSANPASTPGNVIGCYADLTAMSSAGANNWQIGTISRDSTGFYWQNSAGVKWGLVLSTDKMATDKNNPYYADAKEFVFTLDPDLKYYGVLGIAGSAAPTAGPGYYVNAALGTSIPSTHRDGFGWYSSLFPLINSPVQGFQLGLSSTWIQPNFAQRDAATAQKLCTTGTNAWIKKVASDPSYGTYGYDLMQTIEGSLGWWAGEKYPSAFPKYQANVTQNCYTSELATPGWGFFSDQPTAQNATGLVQLSNQILLPPDGMTFQPDSSLPQLGVTWLSLPLPAFDHKYSNMAGKNAWTLFLKTGNFSGPVQFVAPQFWADGSITNSTQKGLTLDTLNGSIGQLSSEWNSIPYYEDKGSDGTLYSKLPQLQLPSDSQGKLTFSRDLMAYSSSAVATAMASSLTNGTALPTLADPAGVKSMSLTGQSSKVYQHGETVPYLTQLLSTSTLNSGIAFGLSLPSNNATLQISQYYASKNGTRVPVDQSQVPVALAAASFSPKAKPTFVYQSPNWWSASPSASQTFSIQLNDGSSVEYTWYRFVDQPALQRFELDATEKANLQAAAEKIQREWSGTQLIKNPTEGTLANFDSGLLVKPPKGLEVGFVPIVTKQYFGAPTPGATPSSPVTTPLKKITISCVKGKVRKTVRGFKPVCPVGYTKA